MTDLRATVAALQALREIGVRLSIDDFGTGYASLSYLQRFQADTVKIDQSFVQFAGANESNARIIEAIVALAQTFGMTTVAEGVETAEQLEMVASLGCDATQGFLHGKAVDAESATWYVEDCLRAEAPLHS